MLGGAERVNNKWKPSRRSILAGIACAPALRSSNAQSDVASLYQGAKREGEVTWYTSHYPDKTAENIRMFFMSKYPDVKMNLLRAASGPLFQRLGQELKSGTVYCDVIGSSDTGHYVTLKDRGLLEKYIPQNLATMLEVFRNLDPDGYYHVTSVGVMTTTYNTKVGSADSPKNWQDLLDNRWKGKAAVSHPGFSGYSANWAMVMFKLYGRSFFTSLRDRDPQIGRGVSDVVRLLASGERSVGVSNVATTLETAARGNPIAVNYASDGVVVVDSPSAILRGSKHPNASRLLMEFLCSREVSELMVKEFGESLHKDVPSNAGAMPLDRVKTHRLTPAEIAAQIGQIKELWRDTFGV
jgi:iron(III) transport system substrate-binding protein